jgi:alkanesulfonate monooxygenase SsuD/methylene tetrahydromethanopterin reductase-like flavin-dependent oxidoreductase (luciferase family)
MGRGFALHAGVAPDVIRAAAREAEAAGYDSFWVNHPGPIDGLASLAVAAGVTTRISLGVGVVPLHTHGPDRIVADIRAHGASCSGWEARIPGPSGACGRGSPR